jgi:hypothetical protein
VSVRGSKGPNASGWEAELAALGVTSAQAVAVLRAAAAAGLTADDLLEALRLLSQPTTASARTLTAAEEAFLADHGGLGAHRGDEVTPSGNARARPAGVALELFRDALTVHQAADLLGTAPDVVVQRVHDGGLYGFTAADRLLLPRWQFASGAPLPHLADVLDGLPAVVHPLTFAGFMTSPSDELDGVSPAQWLLKGGDAGPVLFALSALANW